MGVVLNRGLGSDGRRRPIDRIQPVRLNACVFLPKPETTPSASLGMICLSGQRGLTDRLRRLSSCDSGPGRRPRQSPNTRRHCSRRSCAGELVSRRSSAARIRSFRTLVAHYDSGWRVRRICGTCAGHPLALRVPVQPQRSRFDRGSRRARGEGSYVCRRIAQGSGASARVEIRPKLKEDSTAPLGVRGSYRCSCSRSGRVALGALEEVMAKPDSGNPTPGWPDLTKPDTRGGGNSGKK